MWFLQRSAAVLDCIFNSYRIRVALSYLGFSPPKDEPFSPVSLWCWSLQLAGGFVGWKDPSVTPWISQQCSLLMAFHGNEHFLLRSFPSLCKYLIFPTLMTLWLYLKTWSEKSCRFFLFSLILSVLLKQENSKGDTYPWEWAVGAKGLPDSLQVMEEPWFLLPFTRKCII